VTIITAVYNGYSTIEGTIKSILSQSYPYIEYIVIDGASTDGTLQVLHAYDDYIDYWLSEPDKGIYDAFNKAIDLALGDWLYFIGADDKLFDPDVLKDFFQSSPDSRMLYGNVLWGNSGKIYDGRFGKLKIYTRNICQQAIFYHRTLFTVLGKFDPQYSILADYVFNMKAFGYKDTNPHYVNRIVAEFSDKGLSSNEIDEFDMSYKDELFKNMVGDTILLRFLVTTRIIRPLTMLYRATEILLCDGPMTLIRKTYKLLQRQLRLIS